MRHGDFNAGVPPIAEDIEQTRKEASLDRRARPDPVVRDRNRRGRRGQVGSARYQDREEHPTR